MYGEYRLQRKHWFFFLGLNAKTLHEEMGLELFCNNPDGLLAGRNSMLGHPQPSCPFRAYCAPLV